jgi:hypothetical protein
MHTIAGNALKRNGSVENALGPFISDICSGAGLLAALMGSDAIRAAAEEFLTRVARDMRGPVKAVPGEPGGAGQSTNDSHLWDARAENLERDGSSLPMGIRDNFGSSRSNPDGEDGDQRGIDALNKDVPSSPTEGSGDALVNVDSQFANGLSASPQSSDRLDHRLPDSHVISFPPVEAPAKSRLEIIKNMNIMVGPSIFDRTLRDGLVIGDIKYSSLDLRVEEGVFETELFKRIRNHAVPSDPDARVRDFISPQRLKRMMQKAAEIANDA